MAGHLPKPRSEFHPLPWARIAIIASMWHRDCVEGMVARCQQELLQLQVNPENLSVHRIPGSLELPLAARTLFEIDAKLDAVIAFGVILRGQTTHDYSVIQQVVHGFGLVSDRFGKPIINEVIGVTDIADAQARSAQDEHNKGMEAAFAVSEYLSWRKKLQMNNLCGTEF